MVPPRRNYLHHIWPQELFLYFLNKKFACNLKIHGQILMQFYVVG